MNSIEGAAKLTLPYLSARVLGTAPCNSEGKRNGNWNSLESKIPQPPPIYLYRAGYIQASKNALQVLIN